MLVRSRVTGCDGVHVGRCVPWPGLLDLVPVTLLRPPLREKCSLLLFMHSLGRYLVGHDWTAVEEVQTACFPGSPFQGFFCPWWLSRSIALAQSLALMQTQLIQLPTAIDSADLAVHS